MANLIFMALIHSSREENQLPWLVNIGSCSLDNVLSAFKISIDNYGKAPKKIT